MVKTNPFKPNVIENNPSAFGLRTKEIIYSVESLNNNNSLFITGSRGIGKSSLGLQLQNVLKGNNTLLERCSLEAQSNDILCIYYACASDTSIEELSLDILYELEQEILLLPELELKKIKPTLELNFGVIKAKFEGEIESKKISPSSIANRFVNGLRVIYEKIVSLGLYSGINIMIDEVDQLPNTINFGHFIKIVHETLSNRNCNQVTFIFAGQDGSFTRFNSEDPSFERIVKCVPLAKLSWDASEYILDYACANATPKFIFHSDARNLILSISSGFPYLVHLIGDGCFRELPQSNTIDKNDVLAALSSILLTDKREKFTQKLKRLSINERNFLFYIAHFRTKSLPAEITYSSIEDSIPQVLLEEESLDEILNSLEIKGILYPKKDKSIFLFSEELFRIFISYLRIEMMNSTSTRREFFDNSSKLGTNRNIIDRGVQTLILQGDEDNLHVENLSPQEKKRLFQEYVESSVPNSYSNAWEGDDFMLDN